MKLKLALFGTAAALLLLLMASAVTAQEGVPPPYAGLQNPFPWGDAAAQEAGLKLYAQCSGCHGTGGGNIAAADFSAASFPQELEAEPDYFFWLLTEGALSKGMPPYKSSLSDEQRWQVLTYMHTLGSAAAAPAPAAPAGEAGGSLTLTAPQQGQAGESLTLTATLKDKEGKPIAGVPVRFFTREDFFAKGLMEVGDAPTDREGVAVFDFVPLGSGQTEIVARYNSLEATATVSLAEAAPSFYHPEAGLHLPTLGEEIFIGPESSRELGQMGEAPTSAFRLPGGVLSWLLLFVGLVVFFWAAYFRVMFYVFRIQTSSRTEDSSTRLLPLAGLALVVVMGIVLTLMILTGPYSHFNLW